MRRVRVGVGVWGLMINDIMIMMVVVMHVHGSWDFVLFVWQV